MVHKVMITPSSGFQPLLITIISGIMHSMAINVNCNGGSFSKFILGANTYKLVIII